MERSSLNSEAPELAFDELIRRLGEAGFSLHLHDYVEFTAIFRRYTGTRDNFKYYLAPIVCRNKEEQAKFYAVYDSFYTDLAVQREKVVKKQYWIFRSIYARLFLFLLLIGGVKAVLVFSHRKKEAPVVTAPSTPVTPDSAVTDVPSPDRRQSVFVAKPMKPGIAAREEEKSRIVAEGSPIEKENTIHSTVFGWLVVLGGTCLVLSASFFPQKKSKLLPEVDLDSRVGDSLSQDLPFLPKDYLIQPLPVLSRIAGNMRQPIPTDVYRLDIRGTIRESVHQYGLITPVYSNVERKAEYLVLIDRRNELLYSLYRSCLQMLIRDRVAISYYFYKDRSGYYPDGTGGPLNRYGLWERHSTARLMVMGSGESLLPDWWEKEAALEPLFGDMEKAGLFLIADIGALREYLRDEDLFQWVCALAVYPSIKWEVLVAVGAAVLTARNAANKLNLINLHRIVRLEWLKGSVIPQEKRVELLKALDPDMEIATRKALLELLQESDGLLAAGSAVYKELLLQRYTQCFVLFANDVKNRQYEEGAKNFMSLWSRKKVVDMATVIYLRNPEKAWSTPLRSSEDRNRAVGAERFMNELLARRVINDPRIRRVFRNAAMGFFMLLVLLFLFKDNIQGWGINKALGLIESDYRENAVTVVIPVNDCVRRQAVNGKLMITLNNYDNNQYTKTYSIVGVDTVRAEFEEITMAGKAADRNTFQLILDKEVRVNCLYKEYYSQYVLEVRGEDCGASLYRPAPPNYYGREGNANQQ